MQPQQNQTAHIVSKGNVLASGVYRYKITHVNRAKQTVRAKTTRDGRHIANIERHISFFSNMTLVSVAKLPVIECGGIYYGVSNIYHVQNVSDYYVTCNVGIKGGTEYVEGLRVHKSQFSELRLRKDKGSGDPFRSRNVVNYRNDAMRMAAIHKAHRHGGIA